MIIRNKLTISIICAAWTVSSIACNRDRDAERAAPSGQAAEPAAPAADRDEHAQTADEKAEEAEPGDLDRTVEELLTAKCEHGIPTYTCDECRYEVGFVKVAESLIQQGLITTATVEPRVFESAMTLNGEVSFDEREMAKISPPVPGIVKRLAVGRGERVREGQVLIEMDSLAYSESTAEYLAATSALQAAQTAYDRQKSLWDQRITSEREFLEASSTVDAAKIRLQSARLGLNGIGLSESDARRAINSRNNRMSLRAPMDGDIFVINAVRGEMIEPGADAIVMGSRQQLVVWVDLYEHQIAPVVSAMTQDGIKVEVSVSAWPDRVFAGRLDFVDGVMDEATRTVKARVMVDNAENLIKPGMFATVRPSFDQAASGLAIPQNAVLTDEGRQFVFVHHEGPWYVRRPVTTRRSSGGFTEITAGLTPGQTVVANGAFLLKSDVLRSKMGAGCAD